MTKITNFVWNPVDDCIISELDGTGAVQAVYTNEPQQYGGVLSQRRGTTSHYHHHDALGSTRFLTDSSGNVTDTYLHDAWGNLVASTGTTTNPFKWVGKYGYYTDNSTAQVYVRARMYQPTVARWTGRDPVPLPLGKWYLYAASNAVILTDPSGEICATSKCGPDVTEWFARQIEIIRTFRDDNLSVTDEAYRTLMKSLKFELSHDGKSPHSEGCPTTDCPQSVTLCGKCRNNTDLGNIAYGYVADFSLEIELWGGLFAEVGTAQPRGVDKYSDLFPILCGYAFRQRHFGTVTFPRGRPDQNQGNDLCHFLNNQLSIGGQLAFDPAQLFALNLAARFKIGKDILALWETKFGKDPIAWLQEGIRQFEGLKDGCLGQRDKDQPKDLCLPCESVFRALDLSVNPDGTITWGNAY
ncbi:MAG: RHS repeat-associated core domain-containing protein [Planctomycetia bacterium]